MLNIGRLRPGGAEYYVGEVATSAEDYYLGHGEAPGRWVGSLAPKLGLDPGGPVDPDHFRRLLEGRHPITGEQLVAGRRAERVVPHVSEGPGNWLTAAEAAHQLRCSEGYLRRLLRTGALTGEKAASATTGRAAWRVRRSVVNEYATGHHAPKARPGFDVTLRPPKSVSILWALGSDEQQAAIRAAHREAVDEVVRYLQAHAVLARRKGDHVLTDGLVAAAFDHRTSRSGDPLLHTHVVVANLTHTALGTWRALDGRPLFDHALSGGHLYQAHLRNLLSTRLGVRWTPVQNGWAEVIGVPSEVITEFSRRRDEIEELLAESGYTSARARRPPPSPPGPPRTAASPPRRLPSSGAPGPPPSGSTPPRSSGASATSRRSRSPTPRSRRCSTDWVDHTGSPSGRRASCGATPSSGSPVLLATG